MAASKGADERVHMADLFLTNQRGLMTYPTRKSQSWNEADYCPTTEKGLTVYPILTRER